MTLDVKDIMDVANSRLNHSDLFHEKPIQIEYHFTETTLF